MKDLRNRKYLLALFAILLVFAGCKGESPTAPPVGGPTPGPTPPPSGSGITIALTVSNPSPLVNSTTTITATVTQSGNPVPNGTAVEFLASPLGRFTDTGRADTVRTTTNGTAAATLTSATPGTATVTAIVGSVVQTVTVTFQAAPTGPAPPPDTAPAITSVTPQFGRPEGGEVITINGRNLRTPVRVLFDLGNGDVREAFVVSATPTQIQVLSPRVNLTTEQLLAATITVITEQGTPNEQRVNAPTQFTYRRAVLTPVIRTISPATGPVEGGTRVTIFGEAFEAPVQVFFGVGEAQVINTTFDQIIVVSPPARDTTENGATPASGLIPIQVNNVASGTGVTSPVPFRYAPAMAITNIGPLTGSSLGGTRVEIDGIGFDDPVAVTIGTGAGAVSLTPVFVSGTKVIALTQPLASPCSAASGTVTVTNINTGLSATSQLQFSFLPLNPTIVSVSAAGPITPGSSVTVVVNNPGVGPFGTAFPRFTINGRAIVPTPAVITSGTGNQNFTLVIPTTGFTFPTVNCTIAATGQQGTQLGPIDVTLDFNNVTTACPAEEVTLTLQPPGANPCLLPPSATVTPAAPASCTTVAAPVPSAGTATGTATFTVSNAANARDLVISGITAAATTNLTSITVAPAAPVTIPAGGSQTFTITVDPTAAGAFRGDVTLTTNDPARATVAACVTGNAT